MRQNKSLYVFVSALVIMASLMLASMAQAAGANVKVIVQNKTGKDVVVTLEGKTSYVLEFTHGVTEIFLQPGSYVFSASSQCTGLGGKAVVNQGTVWIFKCRPGEGDLEWISFKNQGGNPTTAVTPEVKTEVLQEEVIVDFPGDVIDETPTEVVEETPVPSETPTEIPTEVVTEIPPITETATLTPEEECVLNDGFWDPIEGCIFPLGPQ